MTMLTQAEKRRMREQGVSHPPATPAQVPAPPVPRVEIVYANVQQDNIVSKIKFGEEARNLLPHLAALWDNGK